MVEIEKSIVVGAFLWDVYNQWTQFEDFPRFMEGVLEVRQLDDKRLHWRAKVAGVEKEWHAEIVAQVPHRRVAGARFVAPRTRVRSCSTLFRTVPG
jgi:uncharacterized membrane protein